MNPLPMVRALKGAPISVLFLLWLAGQPVSAGWLVNMSGYTDKPVTRALDTLREYGLIVKAKGGWTLAEGIQLSLGENRNNSEISSTTTTSLIVESKGQQVEVEAMNRNYSENHQILQDAGVGEPMAKVLASLPHVTPAYLEAHLQKAESDGLGLVIHRIKSGDKIKIKRDLSRGASVVDVVSAFRQNRR